MGQSLQIVIALACFGVVWVEYSPVKFIRWILKLKRLKPFDCEACMSFWAAVIYCLYKQPALEQIIFILATTPILARVIITKLI